MESLLKAMPDVTQIPPPMLREARAFCVEQLANAFPQLHDDHPMLVQLVKEVRAALRRSVPDAFLLQALADAGSVWATPGASHWPVAWLHQLAPAAPGYFAPPRPWIAERFAEFLTAQLAATRLPSSGPQAHLSHVLDRIGRCMQTREAANVLVLAPGRDPIVHAYREVAVPLLTLRPPPLRPAAPPRPGPAPRRWPPLRRSDRRRQARPRRRDHDPGLRPSSRSHRDPPRVGIRGTEPVCCRSRRSRPGRHAPEDGVQKIGERA